MVAEFPQVHVQVIERCYLCRLLRKSLNQSSFVPFVQSPVESLLDVSQLDVDDVLLQRRNALFHILLLAPQDVWLQRFVQLLYLLGCG